eukprot:756044-Hanusia_phi.AAC.3
MRSNSSLQLSLPAMLLPGVLVWLQHNYGGRPGYRIQSTLHIVHQSSCPQPSWWRGAGSPWTSVPVEHCSMNVFKRSDQNAAESKAPEQAVADLMHEPLPRFQALYSQSA